MALKLVLFELFACAGSRVKSFDITSRMDFLGETLLLVRFWFVFKTMFVDCWVDRVFQSVFRSWPYLWFNWKSSERVLTTSPSSLNSSKLQWLWSDLNSPSILNFFQEFFLLKYQSVQVSVAISLFVRCVSITSFKLNYRLPILLVDVEVHYFTVHLETKFP